MAKSVLITGCSTGGIGYAAAVQLAAKGYNVLATVRSVAKAGDLASADNVTVLELDVREQASVDAALAQAGDVDVLVNNAGFEVFGPLEEMAVDDLKDQFETNVYGPFRLIRGVLPGMRAKGSGVIVNVSSVAGRVAGPLNGLYSASKWALEALSESLKYEVGHFGIRVHIVEPGGVETPFGANRRLIGAAAGAESPYAEIVTQWESAGQRLNPDGAAKPEVVGAVIVDAVENGDKFRYPATQDAEFVLSARKAMTDDQFEQAMRQQLGITW
ncbi:MAG: short-chain dehydrogenase/reductase [Chloroflexi bacterium]|nr:MAG: short-chain dehydrogenase/reductase [Chloroflexota bacterium]